MQDLRDLVDPRPRITDSHWRTQPIMRNRELHRLFDKTDWPGDQTIYVVIVKKQ